MNTWLLFLPLFPVQVQTLIVVIIGMLVLLLDFLGLVHLGQLLIFHIYLSMSPTLSPQSPQGWVVRVAHLTPLLEYVPNPEPPTPGARVFVPRVRMCSGSASSRSEIMDKKGKSQEEIKSMRAQQAQQAQQEAELMPRPAGALPGA
ncbi:ZDHHC11 isoform 8 [Pan troglodytes]|uniref:ZDHHC11 isoform 8 n=2 Tax=Pan TaxID=9596 RepID=A0A2J8JY27_PANTR|nr:ZDHHC11 isoform 8 [Pan troglodytes]